jgi:hypothetical protein
LTTDPSKKPDADLARTLAAAGPDDEITVILELAQSDDGMADEAERVEDADQLATAAWDANRTTIEALANLGLRPRGGRFAPVVVVTGNSEKLRRALTLDAVTNATLDTSLSLVRPEIPKSEKGH